MIRIHTCMTGQMYGISRNNPVRLFFILDSLYIVSPLWGVCPVEIPTSGYFGLARKVLTLPSAIY